VGAALAMLLEPVGKGEEGTDPMLLAPVCRRKSELTLIGSYRSVDGRVTDSKRFILVCWGRDHLGTCTDLLGEGV
jgi:hypothetical protein